MKRFFTTLLTFAVLSTASFAQTAPNFTFTDIHGDQHELQKALEQGFIVLIDMFFVDCGPCQTAAPEIQAIHDDYQGKNVLVWSLSDVDSHAYIEEYKTGAGLTYTAGGIDGGAEEAMALFKNQFSFIGYPTVSVICPDGSINWDIWPYTTGAPEWRNAIEACGVEDHDPYISLVSSVGKLDKLNGEWDLSPNPASNSTKLTVNFNVTTTVQIDIINLVGQEVQTVFNGKTNSGQNEFEINTAELKNGIYFVKIQGENNFTRTLKLMVQ